MASRFRFSAAAARTASTARMSVGDVVDLADVWRASPSAHFVVRASPPPPLLPRLAPPVAVVKRRRRALPSLEVRRVYALSDVALVARVRAAGLGDGDFVLKMSFEPHELDIAVYVATRAAAVGGSTLYDVVRAAFRCTYAVRARDLLRRLVGARSEWSAAHASFCAAWARSPLLYGTLTEHAPTTFVNVDGALFASLVAAVGVLGACGVVHRDISPSNVVVDARGRARLIDFECASAVVGAGGGVRSPYNLTTLFVCAPELLFPRDGVGVYDAATEAWAVAACAVHDLLRQRRRRTATPLSPLVSTVACVRELDFAFSVDRERHGSRVDAACLAAQLLATMVSLKRAPSAVSPTPVHSAPIVAVLVAAAQSTTLGAYHSEYATNTLRAVVTLFDWFALCGVPPPEVIDASFDACIARPLHEHRQTLVADFGTRGWLDDARRVGDTFGGDAAFHARVLSMMRWDRRERATATTAEHGSAGGDDDISVGSDPMRTQFCMDLRQWALIN
jgi:hypothetical protein